MANHQAYGAENALILPVQQDTGGSQRRSNHRTATQRSWFNWYSAFALPTVFQRRWTVFPRDELIRPEIVALDEQQRTRLEVDVHPTAISAANNTVGTKMKVWSRKIGKNSRRKHYFVRQNLNNTLSVLFLLVNYVL